MSEPRPTPLAAGTSETRSASPQERAQERQSPLRLAARRFRRNRPAWWSAWYLILLLAMILLWPMVLELAGTAGPRFAALAQDHDPDRLSDSQFAPPNRTHWFGTDVHGRDVFARILAAARISMLVGLVGAGVSLVIGVLWGAVAGYCGGRLDNLMMRTVDVFYSLPSIIFVIVLLTTLGEWCRQLPIVQHSPVLDRNLRILLLVVGLGAVSWLTMSRIVRGQVLSLRSRAFVEASRTLGASPLRILARHILPNILGVVIIYVALTVPAIVLYESFLSFLGLGIQPPMASWGTLLAEGVEQINPIRIYWWLILFPGSVLVITLLAFNFVGDGLRDAWDVKGRS